MCAILCHRGLHINVNNNNNNLMVQSDIHDTEEVTSMTVDENHESEPISHETQQKKNCCFIMEAFYTRVYNVYYFIKSLSSSTLWLWLTQVLDWMTMLSLLFFITNFVGSIVYDGSPDAEPNSKERKDYDKGVRMGLVCQGIGFASSLCFSLFLFSKYSHKFQTRAVYISIHVLTFLATGILTFSKSIYVVASLHIIFGCFYSWIQIIPFTLLWKYKVSMSNLIIVAMHVLLYHFMFCCIIVSLHITVCIA